MPIISYTIRIRSERRLREEVGLGRHVVGHNGFGQNGFAPNVHGAELEETEDTTTMSDPAIATKDRTAIGELYQKGDQQHQRT